MSVNFNPRDASRRSKRNTILDLWPFRDKTEHHGN